MRDVQIALGALAAVCILLLALALRRLLGALGRFLLRAGLGGGVLAALTPLQGALGLRLGVNWFNLTLLGLLGAPGMGLLLLLNWLVQ